MTLLWRIRIDVDVKVHKGIFDGLNTYLILNEILYGCGVMLKVPIDDPLSPQSLRDSVSQVLDGRPKHYRITSLVEALKLSSTLSSFCTEIPMWSTIKRVLRMRRRQAKCSTSFGISSPTSLETYNLETRRTRSGRSFADVYYRKAIIYGNRNFL